MSGSVKYRSRDGGILGFMAFPEYKFGWFGPHGQVVGIELVDKTKAGEAGKLCAGCPAKIHGFCRGISDQGAADMRHDDWAGSTYEYTSREIYCSLTKWVRMVRGGSGNWPRMRMNGRRVINWG